MATYTPKELHAYSNWPLKSIKGLVAANASVLEQGQLMAFNTSTSKWVAYSNGGSNGVGTPLAVLSEQLEISASDQMVPLIWQGPIKKSALVGYDANAKTNFGSKIEENPESTVVFLRG